MPTIQSGSTLERYFDDDTTITITPASGGSVRFGCSAPVGATRPADRVIYSATSIAIPGGSTVFAQAVGGDAGFSESGVVELWQFGLSSVGFSAALRAAVAYCVSYAAANGDRSPTIVLPEGEFTHDGLTVNIPPWVSLYVGGTTRIACEGQVSNTNPFLWIRADLTGYTLRNIDDNGVGDYSDGAANVGRFLSGPGRVQIKDTTNSGCLLRIGSGDGVMGTLYTGGATIYTTKFSIGPIHIRGGDEALQFTNYQVFSVEIDKIQINGARYPVVTSTSTQGFDFGEQTLFHKPFISNTIVDAVTMNSSHQFLFLGGSITFTAGTIVKFNADNARVHTLGVRLERFTKISDTSGNFPKSVLTHGGRTHIIPTRRRTSSAAYDHHLRVFWDAASGQTYQVCPDEIYIDMGTSAAAFNQFSAHPSNLYLASQFVDINERGRCNVGQSTPATLKASPIWSRNNAFPNATFADGNINGWHKGSAGTIAYQSTDGYEANGCLEVVATANQPIVNGPRILDVQPGGKYAADFAVKVLSAGATANFAVQCVVHWFRKGVARTLSGATPLSVTITSNVVTVGSDANHGLRIGDQVWISGATDTGGIVAANLNGWRRVSAVNSTISWAFEAGAAATSTTTGGGAAVVVEPPVTYISSSATQSKTFDNATVTAATGTGSISGTTLTITDVQYAIVPGAVVTGTGVTGGTTIVAQLTGTPGREGTYQVSASQTVASTAITCTSTGLKDLWLRHGGSLVLTAPAEAIAAVLQVQTGSAHTGTVRFDNFCWASLT